MNFKKVLILLAVLVAVPAMAATDDLLSIVPEDAVTVGVVRLDQLKSGEFAGMLFDETSDITTDGEAMMFLQEAGFNPMTDADTLVFAMLPREGNAAEGEFLLLIEGRFDPVRLSSAVARRGATPAAASGMAYYTLENVDRGSDRAYDDEEQESWEHEHGDRTPVVSFPSSRLAIAGTEAAVVEALRIRAEGGSSFLTASNIGRDLGSIDRSASAWAMMDVQRSARMGRTMTHKLDEGHAESFGKALRYVSTIGVWASERNGSLEFGGVALSSDAETRELLEDVVRGITAGWRMAAREENPEWLRVIRGFDIGRDDQGVNIKGEIPVALLKDHETEIATK